MLLLNTIRNLSQVNLNLQNIICKAKYLFIISHMRSRSSVLSHILGSNPDVCGYAELHVPYRSRRALFTMRLMLSNDLKCKLTNKYLLDKILHDRFFVADKIFTIAKPKVIFLLRDPESTFKSIIDMDFA